VVLGFPVFPLSPKLTKRGALLLAVRVTVVEAKSLVLAWLVAVTATVGELGAAAGAV
jgi:hypothetical protein